jgi:hypothetical protein
MPALGGEAPEALNGGKLRIEQARRLTVQAPREAPDNDCLASILTVCSGEKKKKRSMQELELRAAEAQVLKPKSSGPSDTVSPRRENNASSVRGKPATGGGSKDVQVRSTSDTMHSNAILEPDLCPTITKEQHPAVQQQVVPSVRKVHTIFPFDLSDPFKFRGTQMSFWRKNEHRETGHAYDTGQKDT